MPMQDLKNKTEFIMIKTKQAGFTIFELVITLFIMAIIAAIAFPAMSDSIARARANEVATAIYNGLNQAKSGAIIGQRVGRFSSDASCNFEGTLAASRAGSYRFEQPYGVTCRADNVQDVFFLPDGSVTTITSERLVNAIIFTVSGGSTSFVVTLHPTGLIEKEKV